jgi:hypothetical protein
MIISKEIRWSHSISGNGIVTKGHKSVALLEDEFNRLQLRKKRSTATESSTLAATMG